MRTNSKVSIMINSVVLAGVLTAAVGAFASLPVPKKEQAREGNGAKNAPSSEIRDRLRQSLLPPAATPKLIADAESFLRTLRADGSWADQDYADTNREVWKAGAHLGRVLTIAKAFYAPGSTLAARPDVRGKIALSLGHWLQADPKNDNWWHNQVGVPLQVGEILILMGADAPPAMRTQGTALMTRSTMTRMTGQNLVWAAEIQIMRGILAGAPELIGSAYDRMWQEVRVARVGEEGVQSDASFHQHGPLLYTGGYGAGFVGDVSRFVGYAVGTPYAIPPEKKAILDRYVLDGAQWMLRGGQWDWGVTGRELVRAGKNAGGMVRPVAILAGIPGSRQGELRTFADRLENKPGAPPLVGNRHFWRSDYMAHHRAGWFAATRMDSVRTANTDGLTNGENKKSHHLADGAFYLTRDSGEYAGIYPIWDWHLIPGTTAEQNTVLVPAQVRRMGATRFVGGVSDGMYGAAAMDLAVGDLHAQKAWFYFDKEIVFLGAGIRSTGTNPVATSVNQSLLRGPVEMSAGGAAPQTVSRGEREVSGPSWVWHDRTGYVFPEKTALQLRSDTQTGSLREIGPESAAPITKDVFRLSIDHGTAPTEAAYSYLVLPDTTPAQTAATTKRLPVEIRSNTADLQAVWHPGLRILAVAFRKAGQIEAGGQTVRVDQPCLLLLRQNGKNAKSQTLAVSNPENTALTVTVGIRPTNATLTAEKTFPVDLPGGLEGGKSVVQEIASR